MTFLRRLTEPSFKAGYARNSSESANPNLWDGLVGAWMPSLGITGGTLRDVSGNDNHGTLTNMDGSNWGTTYLNYAGTNQSVLVDSIDERQTGEPRTVCAWFRGNYQPNNYNVITGQWFNDQQNFGIWIRDREHIDFFVSGDHNIDGSVALTGGWQFAAVTVEGGSTATVKAYIDARQTRQLNKGTANETGTQDWSIGCRTRSVNNDRFFVGDIGSVFLHNRALTPDEIQTLYVDSLAPFRKKQQVAFNAYPLTLLQKIRSAAKPTTPVSVRVKHNEEPSYKAGYAKSAGESENPHLWKGLVGAWMPSLGVTDETLRDVSGNGNHGTLTNMDAATDWVATSKGLALDFNRTSNYVTTTFRTNYGNTFGYSVWYRTSSTAKQNLTGSYQNGRSTFNLDLNYTQSTNSPAVGFISGFAQFGTLRHRFSNTNALSLSDGKWHHVCAFVRLGSYATIFFDGKQVPVSVYQANSGSFSEPALDIWLGAPNVNGSTNGAGLLGSLGHAAVYDRILSPQEIQELYVDSLAPFRRKAKPIGYQPNKELIGLFRT